MNAEFPAFRRRPDAKWPDVRYRRIDFSHPGVDRYCTVLRKAYANGTVDYAAFEAIDRDEFLSAYQGHFCDSRVPLVGLLESEVFADAFFEPTGFDSYRTSLTQPNIEISDKGGCEFEGLIADILLRGGAYGGPVKDVAEAKALAGDCVAGIRSLAPDRPWWPRHVIGPWNGYFCDVAWDHTFAVQFIYDSRWFVLCATDTD